MSRIRLVQESDILQLRMHLIRHSAESGRDGDLIFMPYEEPYPILEEKIRDTRVPRWRKPVTEIGWERCWVLETEDGIFGELKLMQEIPLPTALHRAKLSIGIEREMRGKGWGRRMIETAIQWAGEQGSLEWIDLYVFAHNEPAIRLYEICGFRELGRVPDLFRVHGRKIEDIHMARALKGEAPREGSRLFR